MTDAILAERVLHSIGRDWDFFWSNTHPDLVLEFPFASSVGMPTRVAGEANTHEYLGNVTTLLPDLAFRDVRVMPLAEPESYMLEYLGSSPAARNYEQIYVAIMKFKQGKLILFREYWDTTEVARALGDETKKV